ncbi:MAG: hypothetical protein WKG07_27945 [Hymenobacter sp.]
MTTTKRSSAPATRTTTTTSTKMKADGTPRHALQGQQNDYHAYHWPG